MSHKFHNEFIQRDELKDFPDLYLYDMFSFPSNQKQGMTFLRFFVGRPVDIQ